MKIDLTKIKVSLFLKIGLIFLLASLIPVSILAYYSIQKTFNTTREAAVETNLLISRQASQQFDIFLSNVEKTIGVIIEDIKFQNDLAKINQILDLNREKHTILDATVFESFVLLSKDGEVLTLSPFNHSFVGNDYSHQDFFREVVNTSAAYFAPQITVSSITTRPTIHIAVPTSSGGELEYILVAEVSLEGVSKFNNQTKVGETGFSFIIDRNGTIVAHPEERLTREQQNISNIYHGLTQATFIQASEPVLWPKENPKVLFSPSELEKSGWIAIFKQDYSEIFKVPLQLSNQLLIFFVFTVAFIVIATLSLSRQITRPLRELKTAMGAIISKKEFGSRVQIRTRDEIEDLAQEFNSMTASLEESINAISAERNKLELTLTGITDAVVAVDLNRKVVIFNQAAEFLTGYSLREALGKPVDELIKFYDDNEEISPLNYCPIEPIPSETTIFSKKELKLVTKDKRESFVNLITGQIKEGAQANIGCILTLHDITRDKQLEEMKLDFVSMAAHELRTPLTITRGYLSVLLEELGDKLSKEHRSFLDKALISSTQLTELVENLLAVARIERGAIILKADKYEWKGILQEAVNNFMTMAHEKDIKLKLKCPDNLPKVRVDKFRISEVLSNLIANALNYTKSGGTVEISTEINGEDLVTHVKDTGIGIPQSAIPNLFTKFFRVSGVLEQGSKGTGLGLYISKSIVELHNGRIWVESQVDKGSTFSFSLPLN